MADESDEERRLREFLAAGDPSEGRAPGTPFTDRQIQHALNIYGTARATRASHVPGDGSWGDGGMSMSQFAAEVAGEMQPAVTEIHSIVERILDRRAGRARGGMGSLAETTEPSIPVVTGFDWWSHETLPVPDQLQQYPSGAARDDQVDAVLQAAGVPRRLIVGQTAEMTVIDDPMTPEQVEREERRRHYDTTNVGGQHMHDCWRDPDVAALLETVRLFALDLAPRGIIADAVQDEGDWDERATFIREQCAHSLPETCTGIRDGQAACADEPEAVENPSQLCRFAEADGLPPVFRTKGHSFTYRNGFIDSVSGPWRTLELYRKTLVTRFPVTELIPTGLLRLRALENPWDVNMPVGADPSGEGMEFAGHVWIMDLDSLGPVFSKILSFDPGRVSTEWSVRNSWGQQWPADGDAPPFRLSNGELMEPTLALNRAEATQSTFLILTFGDHDATGARAAALTHIGRAVTEDTRRSLGMVTLTDTPRLRQDHIRWDLFG